MLKKLQKLWTYEKTFSWILLTISLLVAVILMVGNVLFDLEGVSDYAKLFSMVGNVGSVSIGLGMFYLGWRQKISTEERNIIRENYTNLRAVISSVRTSLKVKDEDFRLIFEIEGQAETELPKEIESLVKKVHKLMNAFQAGDHLRHPNYDSDSNPDKKAWERYPEIIEELGNSEKEATKIYSKYLRIKS